MNGKDIDNDKIKTIPITIKISKEAKHRIEKLSKKNRRSMTKEIERLIMEAE